MNGDTAGSCRAVGTFRRAANYRARNGSEGGLFLREGSQASQGKGEPREAENRMMAAGYLRDLRLLGVFRPLPPEKRGRGSRAHAHRVGSTLRSGGWSA